MRELRGYWMSLSLLMVVMLAFGCGDDDTSNDNAGSGGSNANAGSNAANAGSTAANTGSGGAMAADACSQFCANAVPLHCPGDTTPCAMECTTYYNNSFCQTALRALIECSATQAASDFECDDQEQASVKASLCVSERTAAQACIDQQ